MPGLFFLLVPAARCPGVLPMSHSDSARRSRTRRPRDSQPVALAELDRRLLGVLCTHRVVTQEQLGRLFPDIPERTLRYRTRRLHDLGLTGRTRPYRERGSAPNHHWPTRRADCLMRGDPTPRGGERKQPNPVFLAHTAALTSLYVALATEAHAAGLQLQQYRREGDAREPFTHAGKERALAPDAMVILADPDGRQVGAFIEIDLGTMSHTRLRQKAELYAAYTTSDAWRDHHPFLPALLFITATDTRATKFLNTLARELATGPRRYGRRPLIAGAAGVAWIPGRLLTEPSLADLDTNTGLSLLDVLSAARAPYEQARAHQREQHAAEDEQRRTLRENPDAMRNYLADHHHALSSYIQALGPTGETTIELLAQTTEPLSPRESEALSAIARDLDQALPEPTAHTLPSPGAATRGEIEMLADLYRSEQTKRVKALAERAGAGPSLRRAWRLLRDDALLDRDSFADLAGGAERDAASHREQQGRREVYLEWRERAARRLARSSGPLGRLTHRAEDYYAQLDDEQLRVCARCEQTIYPGTAQAHNTGGSASYACHYCREPHGTRPYEPASATSTESEANR
jgi:hypothetical protein